MSGIDDVLIRCQDRHLRHRRSHRNWDAWAQKTIKPGTVAATNSWPHRCGRRRCRDTRSATRQRRGPIVCGHCRNCSPDAGISAPTRWRGREQRAELVAVPAPNIWHCGAKMRSTSMRSTIRSKTPLQRLLRPRRRGRADHWRRSIGVSTVPMALKAGRATSW